jgi:hypothetical protein
LFIAGFSALPRDPGPTIRRRKMSGAGTAGVPCSRADIGHFGLLRDPLERGAETYRGAECRGDEEERCSEEAGLHRLRGSGKELGGLLTSAVTIASAGSCLNGPTYAHAYWVTAGVHYVTGDTARAMQCAWMRIEVAAGELLRSRSGAGSDKVSVQLQR